MLVDSHCHLDFDEFRDRIPEVLAEMAGAGVSHALCISVTLTDFPRVKALADAHANLFATVGVHPDYPDAGAVAVGDLVNGRTIRRSSPSARPDWTITVCAAISSGSASGSGRTFGPRASAASRS